MKSMEKKPPQESKSENSMANSTISDQIPVNSPFQNLLEMSPFEAETEINSSSYSLSFMDIFDLHENSCPSNIFDLLQPPPPPPQPPLPSAATTKPESSEAVNTPVTPNYSSISSSSNEDQRSKTERTDEGQQNEIKTKTLLIPKKKKKNEKKKEKEKRFAFMTKSEVDQLDDGYKWRKYGQKAVKNSPFPRSYYRCTNTGCGVKKRVERSYEDPTIVITTYEGTHIHHISPTRGNLGFLPETTTASAGLVFNGGGGGGGFDISGGDPSLGYLQPNATHRFTGSFSSLARHDNDGQEQRCFGSSSSISFVGENGLLQDVVTPQMMMMMEEPKKE